MALYRKITLIAPSYHFCHHLRARTPSLHDIALFVAGWIAREVVRRGGRACLAETPELVGVAFFD